MNCPSHSDLRKRVSDFAEDHSLLTGVDRVLVGFSGGADSTALLVVLRELHPNVTAVHLQHGLRGSDADADVEWCERFCEARSIPFERHDLEVGRSKLAGESVEQAARRCRLEKWAELADLRTVVALGHHADDCLEDLFLRIARGSNATGLTGLRPSRELCGVRIIRPLLGLRRAEIEGYLRANDIGDWCEDRTNEDVSLCRNAVRHGLLPLVRETFNTDEGALRSLEALRLDADFLERSAAEFADSAGDSALALANAHPALFPRVMRVWITRQMGHDVLLNRDAIERLRAELARNSHSPRRIPLAGGTTVVVEGDGQVRVEAPACGLRTRQWPWRKAPRLRVPEADITLCAQILTDDDVPMVPGDRNIECFAVESLPEVLTVRSWRAGDRMVPFGRRAPKKVQDILTDARIPREQRGGVPVIESDSTIIWLAGVRRGEFGRVAPDTTGVVALRLVRD